MSRKMFTKAYGFTLMEVMVVVIMLGLFAAMAIPNYTKSVHKSHERDAVVQLSAIHSANRVYHSNANEYLPTGGGGIASINAGLHINILANGKTYTYSRTAPDNYTATSSWAGTFSLRVDQTDLSTTNPCCSAGTCYSVPAC